MWAAHCRSDQPIASTRPPAQYCEELTPSHLTSGTTVVPRSDVSSRLVLLCSRRTLGSVGTLVIRAAGVGREGRPAKSRPERMCTCMEISIVGAVWVAESGRSTGASDQGTSSRHAAPLDREIWPHVQAHSSRSTTLVTMETLLNCHTMSFYSTRGPDQMGVGDRRSSCRRRYLRKPS